MENKKLEELKRLKRGQQLKLKLIEHQN